MKKNQTVKSNWRAAVFMEGTGLAGLYEICFEQPWKMMKEKQESKPAPSR